VAIVVLTVAIVSTVIALVAPPRDDGEPAAEPWSVTLDGTAIGALTGGADRVVLLLGRPASVVVLDLVDGSEQWRRPAPGDSATGLDVVSAGDDHVVVVRHVDADGTGSVLALDLGTGVTRWRWSLAVGERVDVADGALRRESVRTTGNGPAGTQRIEPRSGEVVRELDPAETETPATDNVLRSVGAREVIEVSERVVEVLVDPSVGATTISFEPTPPG
jgi:hypothetical protein